VKLQHLQKARTLFHGTGVVITDTGLGSALGTNDFMMSYVQSKVSTWVSELEKLTEITITQPHAAYASFMCVFLHRWSYIPHTVPMTSELFLPLDEVLSLRFLPALTSRPAFGSIERELLSLPACLGGLIRCHHTICSLFLIVFVFKSCCCSLS